MSNKPIKKYRSGLIQGAIWLNERKIEQDTVGFKTVSISRSWKNKEDGQWRDETMNLKKADIPKLQVILNKIQEDMLLTNEGDQE